MSTGVDVGDVCVTGAATAIMGTLLLTLAGAVTALYADARATLAYERARTTALQSLIEGQLRVNARVAYVQGQLAEDVGGLARGVNELRQGAR